MKERPTRTTSLSVLVPAYNEQYLIESSLERLEVLADCPQLDRIQVIVVNDGSVDDTAHAIERFKARVKEESPAKMEWHFFEHEENGGKGAAIVTALQHADCEISVIHDADLEYHPRDLPAMIPLFLEQGADAVFGSRFLSSDYRRVLYFRHSLGNKVLTFICNVVSDLNLTDMETCYKMVRTDLLKTIPLTSRDFRLEPELTIKLAKRSARIFEIPISYAGRNYQEGKKITWRDGIKALMAIMRYAISDDIYTRDEYGSGILARLSRAPRFTRWMADVLEPHVGQEVLEIGAGIGNLTVHLTPRTVYCASDINPLYIEGLKGLERTRPYLSVRHTDVTSAETFPKDKKFDTVICLNVIEHVEDDVQALHNIGSVLRDDGTGLVLVPQYQGLYGSLDEVLGHHRRYSVETLTELAEKAGFRVREVLRFNRASVPAWWLNGRLLRKKRFSLFQIKMLNLVVPICRVVEMMGFLPALSLIAIVEKNPGAPADPPGDGGDSGSGEAPRVEEGAEAV
jgi:glycosyltransferase involved in cell wall biosynthesis